MSTLTQPSTPPPYRTPPAVRRLLMLVAGLGGVLMVAIGTVHVLDLISRHTTTETATYENIRAMIVDDASDVRIVGAPAGSPVRVVARVTEGLRSPDRQVERSEDGTLRLTSSCRLFFTGHCDVSYEIRVPSDIDVKAKASAGDVVAEDLVSTSEVDLQSSAGDVTAIDVEAPALRLSSSAGDVEARGVRAEQVRAHSSAGDVSLSLLEPADLIDADSSAGDVQLVVPDTVYRLDASTSAGDVDSREVRIDPDAANAIRARSSAGDVQIEVRR